MLALFALLVCTTSVWSLKCHCTSNSQCDENGFCANGCARQWYGPGCQVGTVSFGKEAKQSTTLIGSNRVFSADLALDGMVPDDDSARSCAHTAIDNPAGVTDNFSWWAVTLDTKLYYVVINVTLLNRKGSSSYRLANFVILYSNDTESDPDPNSSNWHEFSRENGAVGYMQTYTSKNMVIARRVAVYLRAFLQNPAAVLTLCEVLIDGYEHNECPSGFSGPGCLLRACDQCAATGGQCTGDFGSCRYDVCPDRSHRPPSCWITLNNVAGLEVQSTVTCSNVSLSVVLRDTHPNKAATWLQLHLTKSGDRQALQNANISLRGTNSVYYNFTGASANTAYGVSLKLVYCDDLKGSCFTSTGSKVLTVVTDKRESMVNSKTIERQSFSIMTIDRQSASNTTAPKEDFKYATGGVLPGAIGGSFAVIVIIVTIIVIIYFRRRRRLQLNLSAIDLETKANHQAKTRAMDIATIQSHCYEQCENSYESLHINEQFPTSQHYDTLN